MQRIDYKEHPTYDIQYNIMYNGYADYVVLVSTYAHMNARICKRGIYDNKTDTVRPGEIIIEVEYENIFVGDNDMNINRIYAPKGMYVGNTILLKVSPTKYIYVGNTLFSFNTVKDDIIVRYYSPVGDNIIPYPYAVGKKFVYYLEGECCNNFIVPIKEYNQDKDAYEQLYKGRIKTKYILDITDII